MNHRELCLAAAAEFLLEGREHDLRPFLPENLENLFLEVSVEGLAGVLAMVLMQRGDVPPELLSAAKDRVKGETVRNLRWLSELVRLDDVFADAGCDILVLKGAAMLHNQYKSRVAARYLSDLDLMVREEQLQGVEQAMKQLGYCSTDGLNYFQESTYLSVDLHTDPIKRVGAVFTFNVDKLWQDSVMVQVGTYKVLRGLCPEDQFLYQAVHALKHGFVRLSWLLDLALMYDVVQPQALWERAKRSRSERVLGYTFWLIETLFQLPTPIGLRKLVPRLNIVERCFLNRVAQRRSPASVGKLMAAFSLPCLVDRLAYVWSLSAPVEGSGGWRPRSRQLAAMAGEALRSYR
jgi:hypothetical protein